MPCCSILCTRCRGNEQQHQVKEERGKNKTYQCQTQETICRSEIHESASRRLSSSYRLCPLGLTNWRRHTSALSRGQNEWHLLRKPVFLSKKVTNPRRRKVGQHFKWYCLLAPATRQSGVSCPFGLRSDSQSYAHDCPARRSSCIYESSGFDAIAAVPNLTFCRMTLFNMLTASFDYWKPKIKILLLKFFFDGINEQINSK